MTDAFLNHIRATLDDIEAAGLTKRERLLTGPQGGRIHVASPHGARDEVNLCSNNYLGLADHPDVIAAARRAIEQFGFGMASVRFICGAQTLHRELEQAIAKHLGKADAIVFAACFDANGGVFEPLLGMRTRSSPTASTTPRSSTACGSARRSATASPTRT